MGISISGVIFLLIIGQSECILLPFIDGVVLKPLNEFNSNNSMHFNFNATCEQCLCDFFANNSQPYVALNCLSNLTCQFFSTFPVTYTLKPVNQARVYFLKSIFPNSSSCCMPNIEILLERLRNATPITVYLNYSPSAIDYDSRDPHEIAIIERYGAWVHWFNSSNLQIERNNSIVNTSLTFAVRNDFIYTSIDGIPTISVYHRHTNSLAFTINHPSLQRIRKIIFTDDGKNMLVSAQHNQSIAIFDIHSTTNYTFQQIIPFPLPGIHGLQKVNDTFFYASSWNNRTLIAYNYQNLSWSSHMFVSNAVNGSGSHVWVDECKRVWFMLTGFGLRIYDEAGIEIGQFAIPAKINFDFLILPNYILFVTIRDPARLIRYDPEVSCL